MFLIHTLQPIERDVSINLCGRNIGVSENGLYSAKVGAVSHHVSRATVAQHVRTRMTPGYGRNSIYHLPHSLSRDLLRATSDE